MMIPERPKLQKPDADVRHDGELIIIETIVSKKCGDKAQMLGRFATRVVCIDLRDAFPNRLDGHPPNHSSANLK
jgi:hypothetical protein